MAIFLFTYTGYKEDGVWLSENKITNLAGIAALLIALLPTTSACYVNNVCTEVVIPSVLNVAGLNRNCSNAILGIAHLASAALFFGMMAYLCICCFTKIDAQDENRETEKRIYRACGWTIVACLAIMGAYELIEHWYPLDKMLQSFPMLFTFETIALWAFGTAWLMKGDFLSLKSKLKTKKA